MSQTPQPWQQWRRHARRAVHGSTAPTWALDLSALSDGLDDSHARDVVDLSLRVGALMLLTGASAAEATAAILRITNIFGLSRVHVDVTYTSVQVSYTRGPGSDPLTAMRNVGEPSGDYARLGAIQTFITELSDKPAPISEARRRFEKILHAPRHYRRWVVTAANAGLGAGVALLLGGSWLELIIAAACSAAIVLLLRLTGHLRLPAMFGHMLGAMVPTTVAVLVMAGTLSSPAFAALQISPSRVVAAGIVVLVAGLSVMSATRDAIDGFLVTAGARSLSVVVQTFGIVLGVSAVLGIAARLGVPGYLDSPPPLTNVLVIQLIAAAAVAATWSVSTHANLPAVWLSLPLGAFGWIVHSLATNLLELGYGTACAVAATVTTVLAQLIAGRSNIPEQVLSTAAIIAFLPGAMMYRGLTGITNAPTLMDAGTGVTELLGALAAGLGLAMGLSLGAWLGRPLRLAWDDAARRYEDKALRRRTPDHQ